jgi:hypothetical protein
MHLTARKLDQLLTTGKSLVEVLPEWRKVLPPALSDAVMDRRDPKYREQVNVSVRMAGSDDRDSHRAVIEVQNKGSQTISLMSLRLVLEDEQMAPLHEYSTWAATPIAADHEWRGPLLPGQTRRLAVVVDGSGAALKPSLEITELRVWDEQASERLARAVDVPATGPATTTRDAP